jgi:hypothetical protein
VIAVVLNSPNYAAEAAVLLDWGFAELARREVVTVGGTAEAGQG